MMEKVKITNSTILFAILFLVGILIFYQARFIIIVSFIGIGIGVLIMPILNIFQSKLHLPKPLAVIIVFIGILLFIIGVGASIFYLVSDQVSSLTARWPEITSQLETWTYDMFDKYPWLKEQAGQLQAENYIKNSLARIFKGFQVGLVAAGAMMFALVLGLYTAVGGSHYYQSVVEAFPSQKRQRAGEILRESAGVLRGWFKAQLIDMAIIGSLTGIGLWVVGAEYWAVFGLLTAVLGIIPYLGIFIVVIAASLITLASDPSMLPWLIGVFFITQQLEGNVILPLVLKGRAELPVVPLLIFMMVLGTFFGILGVFIAPPVFAIFRTLYIEVYLPRVNNPSQMVEE